ncbi:hypothetical protein NPM_2556 [Nostoc sp. 'Peltigera membranacea cyanobiont' N6]|nr:hypothetical protein NPM_2556 [Nostoc sp. 'Peltigera membranacea cyanobiont' N6]
MVTDVLFSPLHYDKLRFHFWGYLINFDKKSKESFISELFQYCYDSPEGTVCDRIFILLMVYIHFSF